MSNIYNGCHTETNDTSDTESHEGSDTEATCETGEACLGISP